MTEKRKLLKGFLNLIHNLLSEEGEVSPYAHTALCATPTAGGSAPATPPPGRKAACKRRALVVECNYLN